MEETAQALRVILTEVAGLPPNFDAAADFYAELGMPSMKAMQLLMELEDKFQVAIPDDEFIEATSLNRLTDLIQRLTVGEPT